MEYQMTPAKGTVRVTNVGRWS